MSFNYDVALSFAGEDREFVEQVAAHLRQRGLTVFYDRYETAELWGKDLYVHLDEVYRNQARCCLMFLSKFYAAKVWTSHERRAAQARSLTERSEYILPLRLDDTEIPGMLPTIGYIRAADFTLPKIADLVVQKIGQAKRSASEVSSVGLFVDVPYVVHAAASIPLSIVGITLYDFARSLGSLECAWASVEAAQPGGPETATAFAELGFLVAHPVKRGHADFALLERIAEETTRGRISTYVLVTGDGDFIHKVMGLLALGHAVHLVANSDSLFRSYRQLQEDRRRLRVSTGSAREDFVIHDLQSLVGNLKSVSTGTNSRAPSHELRPPAIANPSRSKYLLTVEGPDRLGFTHLIVQFFLTHAIEVTRTTTELIGQLYRAGYWVEMPVACDMATLMAELDALASTHDIVIHLRSIFSDVKP